MKIQGLDFTVKSYALQTYYNLDTCSWKMSQTSLLETMDQCSEQSLEILPNEATMQSGVVYPLPKLGLTTSVTDGGYLHTPTATANQMSPSMVKRSGWWPTPAAHEARLGYQNRKNGKKGTQKSLTTEVIDDLGGRDKVIGQLNPQWVEWLMGWPLGHTDLKR